jgi:hypothetical protein
MVGNSTPGAGTDESEDETNRLLAEFSREDLARHLALFYREPATQLSAASTFIRYGLHLGRRCFYRKNRQSASGLNLEGGCRNLH